MSEITVYKRDATGKVVWQYTGVVVDSGPTWVCLSAQFDRDEADLGFVVFHRGDVFTEWFFSDRWYNIFRVYDSQRDLLKGWYCNITRPATITADSVAADDLELDIFVTPNGTTILLDELEFDALNLPINERIAAIRAVDAIRQGVSRRQFPFHEIRTDTGPLTGVTRDPDESAGPESSPSA